MGKRLLSVSSIEHMLALSTATLVMQSMFSLSSIDDEGVSVDEMLFTRFCTRLRSDFFLHIDGIGDPMPDIFLS